MAVERSTDVADVATLAPPPTSPLLLVLTASLQLEQDRWHIAVGSFPSRFADEFYLTPSMPRRVKFSDGTEIRLLTAGSLQSLDLSVFRGELALAYTITQGSATALPHPTCAIVFELWPAWMEVQHDG